MFPSWPWLAIRRWMYMIKDKLCEEKRCGLVTEQEIKWVVTVPVIWNDDAKQFMREAVKMAGCDTSDVGVRTESPMFKAKVDAISLPMMLVPNLLLAIFQISRETVEVTLGEVFPDRSLKEQHKANGGAWGGMTINESFFNFLKKEEVLSEDVLTELSLHYKEGYIDLETLTCLVKPSDSHNLP